MALGSGRVADVRHAARSRVRSVYDARGVPAYLAVCSQPAVRRRLAPWLEALPRSVRYSPDGRGVGRSEALRYLANAGALAGKRVLVIGRDTPGTLVPQLFALGVYQVVLAELLMDEGMDDIVAEWHRLVATYPGRLAFMGGDGTRLPVRDGVFDLALSESVLEHVPDVGAFLDEMHRALRPGGYILALFGPLWHTYAGPHIGSLGYDHLLLSRPEFLEAARRAGNWWQVLFAERDLFNRFDIDDYLAAFERRFTIDRAVVAPSREGLRFRRDEPATWSRLRQDHSERRLLTRLAAITAQRP